MTLNVLACAGLAFSAVYGHFWLAQGAGSQNYHFVTGLFTSFLSIFAHCMSMFYFIGTGKMVQQAVAEHRLDEGYTTEARGLKTRHFPLASFTIAATMATPVLGGAAHAGKLPVQAHLATAVSALLLNGLTAWVILVVHAFGGWERFPCTRRGGRATGTISAS